jgi:hypothetical protein
VYAKVTTCPCETADASVNTTVEPATATLLTDLEAPATVTAKLDALAVVEEICSLNCKINCLPAEFTAAELKVGADESTPKLNPPSTVTGLSRRVIDASPNCPFEFPPQHINELSESKPQV